MKSELEKRIEAIEAHNNRPMPACEGAMIGIAALLALFACLCLWFIVSNWSNWHVN